MQSIDNLMWPVTVTLLLVYYLAQYYKRHTLDGVAMVIEASPLRKSLLTWEVMEDDNDPDT